MTTSLYAPCAKVLIDTSLWIRVFRDKSGQESTYLQKWLSGRPVVLTRFNQLELLQGCKARVGWSELREVQPSPGINVGVRFTPTYAGHLKVSYEYNCTPSQN